MPKIKYLDLPLGAAKLAVIKQANAIIAAYQAQGFDLTLRQLYYQFVARDLIPNRQQEYKRLGDIVNDGRLAGLIDWNAIVDRTRELTDLATWDTPGDIVDACANQFRFDKWANQPNRVEVWIEKDALEGVIKGVCQELHVPFFSCRGYTSQSSMWAAGQRLLKYVKPKRPMGGIGIAGPQAPKAQVPVILHFGDHDPSGIDMTRDIRERLELFMGGLEVRRLALNMDQVEEYNPPPNPAKLTDSRVGAYLRDHGNESWELDALEPAVLVALIREEIMGLVDVDLWEEAGEREAEARAQLAKIADRYEDVTGWLEDQEG